jgi:hypothetical protein
MDECALLVGLLRTSYVYELLVKVHYQSAWSAWQMWKGLTLIQVQIFEGPPKQITRGMSWFNQLLKCTATLMWPAV